MSTCSVQQSVLAGKPYEFFLSKPLAITDRFLDNDSTQLKRKGCFAAVCITIRKMAKLITGVRVLEHTLTAMRC